VQPLSSEVTLLSDRNSALPVEVTRTGQRSIAFGGAASGLLELRFLNAGSDLEPGDALVTSGLDGVFPPGLPVGSVEQVEPAGVSASFARVLVRPVAQVDQTRLMLVLMVDRSALPPPPPDPVPETRKRRARG
jgi:rod shape-determining protein MreC